MQFLSQGCLISYCLHAYHWAQVDPAGHLVMQASDDNSEAPGDSVAESEPGLEKEFSFGHSLPEPEVELGLAFLSKLQNKGVPV